MQDSRSKNYGILENQIAGFPKLVSYSSMKRFREKLLALIEQRGGPKAPVARAIGVDTSQFNRWTKGEKRARPTAVQLLVIARTFGTTMEYLADDEMYEMPTPGAAGEVLTEDERYVLRTFRNLRLDADEAFRRLTGQVASEYIEPPKKSGPDEKPRRGTI